MAINAKELPLGKVFTPDFRFRIPSFQRAYIWRPEHVLQLIDDIGEASRTPDVPYFLGSLILVRDGESAYQVIDGQQRLVSLSIVVAALRDLERDPEWMRLLDALIVEPGDRLRGIRNEPRLTLRERDAAFFRQYVQEGNLEALFDLTDDDWTSPAQRTIMRNTRQAYDTLALMDDEARHRFASYLVNGVTLVIVTTDDLDGAHRIFDVMNMRGLPLTPSDVFKAHATAALPAASMDAVAARWDDIVDPMGDDPRAVEDFFAFLHLILTRKPASGKLIDEFLADVLQPHIDARTVPAFVERVLAPYATAWRILDHPTDTVLPAWVRDRLEALRDYRNDEWKPVAMWVLVHSFRALADDDASPFVTHGSHAVRGTADENVLGLHDRQRLEDILAALERLTGIDTLNRTAAIERRGHAAAAIRDLDKGYPVRLVRGLAIGADQRLAALVRLHGEMQGDDELIRLLLVRANERKAGMKLARPRRLAALTVMPLDIAGRDGYAGWSGDEHDQWMYRLADMALVQGNADQLDRLDGYVARRDRMLLRQDSKRFPLTAQLADYAECTPAMMRRRQEETVRLIAEYWDIRYDENHTDLTGDGLTRLADAGDDGAGRGARGSKRVTIAQIVAAGLLVPGETLVWERPRKGERWTATVTDDGRFRLEDGSSYTSPTAAARAAGGSSGGLDVWRRSADGRKLGDIWKEYRLQTA